VAQSVNDNQYKQEEKGKAAGKPVTSDTSTDDGDGQRSPPYHESADSSSADGGDDDDGDGDGDGGAGGGVRFTGIHCTCIHTHVSDFEY
jgi:hypothetical protein